MTACSTRQVSPIRWTIAFATLLLAVLAVPSAQASEVAIGVSASQYAVLYEGTGGKNLAISNVTINGNVGVGGTGVVQFSGPGTINGRLDFSAANSGQFKNTNGSNAVGEVFFLDFYLYRTSRELPEQNLRPFADSPLNGSWDTICYLKRTRCGDSFSQRGGK